MTKMNKKTASRSIIFFLQGAVFLYSLSGVASKYASNYEFLSPGFILCYGVEILLLGIYAIIWQQIIKKTDLSVAYTNKAVGIFWSMIWSIVLFNEKIYINNVIGVVLIFIGTIMVNRNV